MSMKLQMKVIKLERRIAALEDHVKRLDEAITVKPVPEKRGPGRPRKVVESPAHAG